MFLALESYYGENIYKNIIKKMNNEKGLEFWDALTHITGDNETTIKVNIEKFIIEKYNWMFLLDTPNLIFIILSLILICGYFYKSHKNRKLLKKWEIEELVEDLDNYEKPN